MSLFDYFIMLYLFYYQFFELISYYLLSVTNIRKDFNSVR